MVYVLLVEALERHVVAERQIAVTMIAAGAGDVDAPSMQQARIDFDAALVAEPVPESASEQLMRELGVA